MSRFWLIACILCAWNLLGAVECGVRLKSPSSQPSPRHSPTPAPHSGNSGSDCGAMVYQMMDCAPYLANGGKQTKPEPMCCSGFKKIMKKNETCLCAALKSTAGLGISLNVTRAKNLPSACGVSSKLPKCQIPDDSHHQPSPAPANPTPKHHIQAPSKSKSPKPAPEAPAPGPSKASSSLSTSIAVLSTLISCVGFVLYESL
ncbi:non-specific lipid transfer protein GPI-anchored 4 [Daucus carota subsp. sativus]|uniref:non-specific lipid transfer protein GPI-anchored 4 n=1 Tax=Daucus carota subsp. sativus TaxID=79200 RepID=UPI0007B25E36|nr:PREDICTED: non-specific lipid-transfer protein-like protein At5g64080 [Daucus carota subsp. sativus]